MLSKKTVFILGAGASYEFGYPLGKGLKKSILKLTDECLRHLNMRPKNESFPILKRTDTLSSTANTISFLLNECQIEKDSLEKFHNDFSYSSRESIDAFLQYRPEFLHLGKALIAISILGCEREHKLFEDSEFGNWYKYLFNKINTSIDSFDTKNISFITYNYDRSLESFFVRNIMSTYGTDDTAAITKLENVPILHIHGKVAGIPWGYDVQPYNASVEVGFALRAISQLNIISEDIESTKIYDEAYSLLKDAEQVFILGFGFDERNLQRLKLQQFTQASIYATRTGITDLMLKRILNQSEGAIEFSKHEGYGIIDFFENEVSLYGHKSSTMIDRSRPKTTHSRTAFR